MNIRFEDVLSTLCSRVEALPTSDFQSIFLLEDTKAAKLCCDVLVAYGFEAKVYHENGISRLYINQPSDSAAAEQKLGAALIYARSLKGIKDSLDALCVDDVASAPDYTMSLTNLSQYDKRIAITILSKSKPVTDTPAARPPMPVPAPVAVALPPKVAFKKSSVRQSPMRKASAPDPFSAGPEIVRHSLFFKTRKNKNNNKPDSYWKQMTLYLKGGMAPATVIIIAIAVILLIIYSLFVVSKGAICPDFAQDKTRIIPWYCK